MRRDFEAVLVLKQPERKLRLFCPNELLHKALGEMIEVGRL
jgi:hypothetical protein